MRFPFNITLMNFIEYLGVTGVLIALCCMLESESFAIDLCKAPDLPESECSHPPEFPLSPDCTPCKNGGICTRKGDWEYDCNCKDTRYLGERCDIRKADVEVIIPARTDNATMTYMVVAGRKYTFYIIILQTGQNETTWYQLDVGDGVPNITFTEKNFLPISELESPNALAGVRKALKKRGRSSSEGLYFIPFHWAYNPGTHLIKFRLRTNLETDRRAYYTLQQKIVSTLPAGVECLPTSRLQHVSHNTDNVVEYRRTDHIIFKAEIRADCFGKELLEGQFKAEHDGKFRYEWTLYKITNTFPTQTPENNWHLEQLTNMKGKEKKEIEFHPHVLLEGLYWIECRVYVQKNYGSTDLGFFRVVLNPPRIVLAGGNGDVKTVGDEDDIILDASNSVDDSFPESTLDLQYTWTCLEPCNKGPWNDSIVTFPPRSFEAGSNVSFFLRVYSKHARNEAAMTVTLLIRNKVRSSVGCVRNCRNFNPGDEVDFICNYVLNSGTGPSNHITWSWIPRDEVNTEKVLNEPYMTSVVLPRATDVLPRHVVCIISLPDQEPVRAEYIIEINQPPIPGSCEIFPPTGMYLSTEFDIYCTQFNDSHLPITYTFYVEIPESHDVGHHHDKGNRLILGHDSHPEIAEIYLPFGDIEKDWDLNVIIEATDGLGLPIEVSIPVKVVTPMDTDVADLFQSLIYKNDSILRTKLENGNDQAAYQIQMIAMYGLNDSTIASILTPEDRDKLLTIVAIDLNSASLRSFSDIQQVLSTLHLLDQIEERSDLEVFENVSTIAIEATADLVKMAHNENEHLPVADVETVLDTTTDSENRILAASSKFCMDRLLHQPTYLATANVKDILDIDQDDDVDREYFVGVRGDENNFVKEQFDEVAESAEDDVKVLAKIQHHVLHAMEHLVQTGVAQLGYNQEYEKQTKDVSLHGQILPMDSQEVSVTLSTLRPDKNTTVNVVIRKEIMDIVHQTTTSDTELQVIETVVNPYCDDTSANPHTPVVAVTIKDEETHSPVLLKRTPVPLEITLPFTTQPTHAELTAGMTVKLRVEIIPPEELDDFAEIPTFRINLPYNSKISVQLSDPSSPSMKFKILAIKDRKPILRDFCYEQTIEKGEHGKFAEFESDTVGLNEDPPGHYLEYYVGILPFDSNNPNTFQNISVAFTRPSCLYHDEDKKSWSEEGCIVSEVKKSKKLGISKLESIKCLCNHASTFAAAYLVIPHTIENIGVFRNFTIEEVERNPVVLITVSVLLALYIIGLLICAYVDRRDERKNVGLTIMADLNSSSLERFYLITVLTGSSFYSGTTAAVSFVMYGSNGRSQIYTLKDHSISVFRRGAIDTFLVPCDKDLGSLEKIRMWTDHSGHDPAWYCRKILIRHIASDKSWYFYVNQWMTVTADVASVVVEIPATTKDEQKQFFVRLRENLTEQFDNALLWLSLFRYSPASTFTRCQRLSSAFAVLTSYLMLDIMSLGTLTEDENGLFDFGDHKINVYSLATSLQLVLFALPFGIIIVALFRNIIPRRIPTLIIWKNVVPAKTDLGDKKLFIPTMHGSTNRGSVSKSRTSGVDGASIDEDDEYGHGENSNLSFWATGDKNNSGDEKMSMSSSNFSIPSTDIPMLEEWIDRRIHHDQNSGQETESENGILTEENKFINNLDIRDEENREAINLARLGRRAMSHAVRHYDPDSFIFRGEHDIPSVESLIDKRIMEGRKKEDEASDEGENEVKPKSKARFRQVRDRFNSLFRKVTAKEKEKKEPWKEVVSNKYLEEIDESLEKEIENREFIQNKDNWKTQIALELCLLPRIRKPFLSWPWWFIFIAWAVCLLSIAGTSAFTVIFGIHYGYLRSMKWLENFLGSIFISKLVVEPLNACVGAFLGTLFGKRHHMQEMLQVTIQDSKNASFIETRKPYNFSVFKPYKIYEALRGNEIFRLTIEARRRKEIRNKLLRLVLYIMLLVPLIIFSYSGHNYYNYGITSNIRNMFQLNLRGEGVERFTNEAAVYDYLENVVLDNVHPEKRFYNERLTEPNVGGRGPSFLSDQQTLLVGVGRIRQHRVKPSKCEENSDILLRNKCLRHKIFKKSTQDTASYYPHWKEVGDGTQRHPPSLTNDGWEFHGKNSSKAMSFSYKGFQGRYDGGGYIFELGRTYRQSTNVLKYMRMTKWLDRRTRAVFVEFTLLNPNINKFVDLVLLIEQGPTWRFSLKSWINPVELIPFEELSQKSDEIGWISVSLLVIIISLIGLIIVFIHDLVTRRNTHPFCSADFWVDLLIILLVIASVGFTFVKFFSAKSFTDILEVAKSSEFVSIQRAAYWDDVQRILFSITLALVYCKTWKLMMFTDKLFLSFALTIKLTSVYMMAFLFMLLILISAYAHSGHFLFGRELWEFATWGEGMITLIDQILGVSFFDEFSQSSPFLGRLFSFSFGFFIVFIGLNFVVALLDLGVHEAKEVVRQRRTWITFSQYFFLILYRAFPTLNKEYRRQKEIRNTKTLPPKRLHLMKMWLTNYLRNFLEKSKYYRLKEMKAHSNRLLRGTGYMVVSKSEKGQRKQRRMQHHIEELREWTADIIRGRLGHEMNQEEFNEYAEFNRKIVKMRITKMERKLMQLEEKIDEFVENFQAKMAKRR